MVVHQIQNFCRIIEIPKHFPQGFCFNGGLSVEFKMVDWFNPLYDKDFCQGVLNYSDEKTAEWEKSLIEFVKSKIYMVPSTHYLIITDFGKIIPFYKE